MQTKRIIGNMKNVVEALRKQPLRWLSLVEMEREGVIAWAKNTRTIRKVIDRDRDADNLLRARIIGVGRQKRYTVQAAGLIRYLQAHGPSLIGTVRKVTKRNIHDKKNGDKSGSNRA